MGKKTLKLIIHKDRHTLQKNINTMLISFASTERRISVTLIFGSIQFYSETPLLSIIYVKFFFHYSKENYTSYAWISKAVIFYFYFYDKLAYNQDYFCPQYAAKTDHESNSRGIKCYQWVILSFMLLLGNLSQFSSPEGQFFQALNAIRLWPDRPLLPASSQAGFECTELINTWKHISA